MSSSDTRRAVLLLTAMNLLNYIDRFGPPAIIELIAKDIPMSDTEKGVVLTSFIWVYMVSAPFFGWLGDRMPRKHLLGAGVALWSLATAAGGFASSVLGLVLSRAIIGVGEAAYATLAPAMIGDYYPPARRGWILSLFYLAVPIGSALGYATAGLVAGVAGWRMAFFVVGVPGLLLALLALLVREPPRGQFDEIDAGVDGPRTTPRDRREPSTRAPSLVATLASLRGNAEYLWTVAGYTAYTFALGGLAQWMPTYLIRLRHLDSSQANTVFGAVTVVTGLLGTLIGGWLAERLRGHVRHPYLTVSWVSSLFAVPFSLLAFWSAEPAALWAALFLAELFVFMSTGPVNAVLVNSVRPSMRTTAFAISIFASHALGDALSPSLIGMASDRSSLGAAVLMVPLGFGVGAALWWWAARRLPEAAR